MSSDLLEDASTPAAIRDWYRPRFHLLPEGGWINDPIGMIQDPDGRFHLFFQHNPRSARWQVDITWGHAESLDMVRWQIREPALVADGTGPDALGCWSGTAAMDGDVPTLVYTGISGSLQHPVEQVCVAVGDRDWGSWHREPTAVIAGPPPGLRCRAFRDPYVWRDGDQWHMIVGCGLDDGTAAILGYRSPDLREWSYVGIVYERDGAEHEPLWTGYTWECPQLPPVGDKRVLLPSVWDGETFPYVAAIVGHLDDEMRLQVSTIRRFDHGSSFYSAASCVTNDATTIVVGWAKEERSQEQADAAGWSGVLSLPRALTLTPHDLLRVEPYGPFQALVERSIRVTAASVADADVKWLSDARLRSGRIRLCIPVGVGDVIELEVLRSPRGVETTRIVYDADRSQLSIDRSRSSRTDGVATSESSATLVLGPGEGLELDVFVDCSIIEVFANRQVVMTTRVYPQRPDSDGIRLRSHRPDLSVKDLTVDWFQSAVQYA